jgi:CRISPR-associated protein Cmr1
MPEVTFDLQVVTPLFLAGVNQQEIEIPEFDQKPGERAQAWELIPEIRAPSFRGLMRYWLRAAVAGLTNAQPVELKDVRDFERYIFGATDEGSSVQVRVKTILESTEKFEKEGRSRDRVTGKDYLYWSMVKSGKGNNYKPSRYYFTHDTTLRVTLSAHGHEDIQARKLECAIASFWLLISLGGLGSRSRRCAGSLIVTNVSGNITKLSFAEARDAQELQDILRQGIQEVKRIYSTQLAAMKDTMNTISPVSIEAASFDTISLPDSCRIWVFQRRDGNNWHSAKNVLDDIGMELQNGRRSILSLNKRAAFGLPLIVRDLDDLKLKGILKDNRRASPLLLKVSRVQKEQFVGVAVLFKTPYDAIDVVPEPDYSLIEKWIEKKLSRMTALEVIL